MEAKTVPSKFFYLSFPVNFTKIFTVYPFDSCAVAAKMYSLGIYCNLKKNKTQEALSKRYIGLSHL